MNTLTFIVQLSEAIAWPLVTVGLAFLLRRQLIAAFAHISTIKYDKLELQFVRNVAAAEAVAQTRLPTLGRSEVNDSVREALQALAVTSPESAIVEAWRFLEGQLVKAGEVHQLRMAPAVRAMPMVITALLYRSDLITEAQNDLVLRLRQIRHQATSQKAGAVTVEQALGFVDATVRLAGSLVRNT